MSIAELDKLPNDRKKYEIDWMPAADGRVFTLFCALKWFEIWTDIPSMIAVQRERPMLSAMVNANKYSNDGCFRAINKYIEPPISTPKIAKYLSLQQRRESDKNCAVIANIGCNENAVNAEL